MSPDGHEIVCQCQNDVPMLVDDPHIAFSALSKSDWLSEMTEALFEDLMKSFRPVVEDWLRISESVYRPGQQGPPMYCCPTLIECYAW